MKLSRLLLRGVVLAAFLFGPWAVRASAEGVAREPPLDKFLALGTASESGVYYPVGRGICALINRGRIEHGIRCLPYATGGNVYNIQAILSGELDLAITRADLAYQAYRGVGTFAELGANRSLRLLGTLYANPVGILVRADSGIEDFTQIRGKRLNIGNLGSGKRTVADLLLQVMGWSAKDFTALDELDTTAMGQAFCAGQVDVLVQAMGIPAAFYDHLSRDCAARFLDIPAEVMAKIRKTYPFLEDGVIPGGLYPHNPQDVRTFSFDAVLLASDRLSEETVYRVSHILFDDLDAFRATHPALAAIEAPRLGSGEPLVP